MPKKTNELSFLDIVLNADAETIQQALDARRRIDQLLVEREQAYRAIAALEEEIENVVGETGAFPFPEPPLPVAGFNSNGPANRKKSSPTRKSDKADPSDSSDPSDKSDPSDPSDS